MVMRNRHGEGNSPGWWDDLPPKVRERFNRSPAAPAAHDTARHTPLPAAPPPAAPAPRMTGELSRLAGMFLAGAVVSTAVVLLALAILRGGPDRPVIPLLDPVPAR